MLLTSLVAAASLAAGARDAGAHLELHARLLTGPRVQAWYPIGLELSIENVSDAPRPVVKAGDGSEVGWREPHVYLTAERELPDGTWEPLERAGIARCGNYDSDWRDEVVVVPPDGTLRVATSYLMKRFQRIGPTRLRVRGHYEYRARPVNGLPGDPLGEMKGVAAFTLVSEPVEVELLAPVVERATIEAGLRLELDPLRAGPVAAFDPIVFTGRLVNRSDVAIPLVRPLPPARHFRRPGLGYAVHVDGGDGEWGRTYGRTPFEDRPDPDWRRHVLELGPGESVEIPPQPLQRVVDLEGVARVRVAVEYGYGAYPVDARVDPTVRSLAEGLGPMADVPPFEVASREVELEIEHPLAIEVLPRREIPLVRRTRSSEIVDVVFVNRSARPLELASRARPGRFEMNTPSGTVDPTHVVIDEPWTLAPGERASVLERFGPDPTWVFARGRASDRWDVRAEYRREGWTGPVRAEPVVIKTER